MRPIATDFTRTVVCVSVCLSVLNTRIYCAKTAAPIEMPFRGLTRVGLRKHVPYGGRDRTNPFVATGVTSLQRGFSPNYFGYLLYLLMLSQMWRNKLHVLTEVIF